jgi:hypothetical protein
VSDLRANPTFGPGLSNQWLLPETWVAALAKSGLIDSSFVIDCKKFNTAMTSPKTKWCESMLHFDGTNNTGVFRVCFQKKFYYFFTERTKQVPYPAPLDVAWKERVLAAAANVLVIPATRSRPTAEASDEINSGHDTARGFLAISLRLYNNVKHPVDELSEPIEGITLKFV